MYLINFLKLIYLSLSLIFQFILFLNLISDLSNINSETLKH